MKYRIILEGEDLGKDVENFVRIVDDYHIASAFAGSEDDSPEECIIVDRVELQVIPAVIP
jgi:hypothetical protein